MQIKGLHDIGTMTGDTGFDTRPLPGNRQQALGQLVQLEAKRPRLERQLELLVEKQKRTQAQLRSARRRTELLMGMVNRCRPWAVGVKKSRLSTRARTAKGSEKPAEPGHGSTLEY